MRGSHWYVAIDEVGRLACHPIHASTEATGFDMKHPIDGLEVFIQIAELGSFNKAAEKLHVTQTALTRRIQRLEAYLGLKLLDRTTRVVVLSTVGRGSAGSQALGR